MEEENWIFPNSLVSTSSFESSSSEIYWKLASYPFHFFIISLCGHLFLEINRTYKGPSYKVDSVRSSLQETCLTARREGLPNALMVGNEIYGDPYIGVLKRKKHFIAAGKRKYVSSFAFHGFYNTDDRYLNLEGEGIKTAYTFRFYFPNVEAAWASRNAVCEQLKVLKRKGSEYCCPKNMRNGSETQVFGGLIFACTSRGLPFFCENLLFEIAI
ncbi:hypothetical protein AMTRI_Chr09g37950 [Amborella trichopoda]